MLEKSLILQVTDRQTERGENLISFTFGGGGNNQLTCQMEQLELDRDQHLELNK